jgi:LDH2 family malate/lactate/ureidoglycolate dehydrogenase
MSGERTTCSVEKLRAVCEAIFIAQGVAPEDARTVTDVLLFAELRGRDTHGVYRVLTYSDLLASGVRAASRPRVVRREGRGTALVEGDDCLGPVASTLAMRTAIDLAREHGIAAVGVRGTNHNGAVGYYASLAAAEGMVGIVFGNARPSMAPPGGRARLLGNNPLAIAVPTAGDGPVLLDTAFSNSFSLRLAWHLEAGGTVGDTWLLDEEGMPTTDPRAAGTGTFRAKGDHLGAGFALVVGLLAATLPGAAFGTDMEDPASGTLRRGVDGSLMVALSSDDFGSADDYRRRVSAVVDQLVRSEPARGHQAVRLPGMDAGAVEQVRERDGIPVRSSTLERLEDLANRLHVSTSGGLL